MTKRNDELKLGAFLYYGGHHQASWRHPDAATEGLFSFPLYKELAQTAERGKFDMIFFADLLYTQHVTMSVGGALEPITLLSALSAVTEKIGLTATASTTYNEPYNIARKFSSLDHISNGRAGWNIVTSQLDIEAHNFGKEKHPEHGLRYEMAKEFVEVTTGLWDTWEDDAIVIDRENGIYGDQRKVQPLNYKGRRYSSAGPLSIPRSPQGHPVLIQAGSSEPGKEFAASVAEVVFTAQTSLEDAKEFYRSLKSKLPSYERTEDSIKIMPGLSPYIGDTKEEAQQKYDQLQQLIHPSIILATISGFLNVDLSGVDIDGPLPDIPDPVVQSNGMKSRVELFMKMARKENLTIRQLGNLMLGSRGHKIVVGTPEEIADEIQLWFQEKACDGFNIMPPVLPEGLNDFVDKVVPILQERGLFRTDYTGNTLRDHLGLKKPVNQRVPVR